MWAFWGSSPCLLALGKMKGQNMSSGREQESVFRRGSRSSGQGWEPQTLGAESPAKRSLSPGEGSFATRPPAGLGRLSRQREEACFSGPGLPWGRPVLSLRAQPSPWHSQASAGREVLGGNAGLAPHQHFLLFSLGISPLEATFRGLALPHQRPATVRAKGAACSSDHRARPW